MLFKIHYFLHILIFLRCVFSVEGIFGGHDIDIDVAPYQVNYGDICGGVLIHRKWAITTAHCGTQINFIRVSSKYRLRGPKISIILHIVHPKYGEEHEFDYDIQLLQLNRSLHFSKVVQRIEICSGNCGDEIFISGWGYSVEKGDYYDILQEAKIHIVPFKQCQEVDKFWYNHTLTARMFCAGGENGDACQGDSGGPAVSLGQLIGLSSFGYGCGRRIPGVYINVSSIQIKNWIQHYVK